MKYFCFLLALFVLSSCAFFGGSAKQNDKSLTTEESIGLLTDDEEETYKSAEQDKYNEEQRKLWPLRQLPSREDVLNFSFPNCKIREITDYSAYIDSIAWRTPYADSVMKADMARAAKGDYSFNETRDEFAGIYKGFIIKHEKKGQFEAVIYTDGKYSNIAFADPSIWIAVSKNGGKAWEYYFTGLYQKQPICPKWYSKLPLIVNKNTLQIEAALLQQTAPHSHPGFSQEYKLVKDGIVVTFDMNVIAKDSDGDGLTDIVEAKFRTNPYNKDTNGNGIPDKLDLNPCQNLRRTESTIVFETIIEKEFTPFDEAEYERFMALSDSEREKEAAKCWGWSDVHANESSVHYANDSIQTVLIVTDDPNIKAVRPKYVRVIVISTEDYKKSRNTKFKSELEDFSISPMFKVDGEDNLFIVDYSYMTGGGSYLVRRIKDGWQIKPYQMYIS